MIILVKLIVLLVLLAVSFAFSIASYFFYGGDLLIRQFYTNPEYLYWYKLNLGIGDCQKLDGDFDLGRHLSENLEFSFLARKGVNIAYIQDIDILSCYKYIKDICSYFNLKGILVAINLSNLQSFLKREDNDLDLDFFDSQETKNNLKDIDLWVSYIVVRDFGKAFTFEERKAILSKLREVFLRSNIGFKFEGRDYSFGLGKQSSTTSVDWETVVPRDDDVDFVIIPFEPAKKLNRTLVVLDGAWSSLSDGFVVN